MSDTLGEWMHILTHYATLEIELESEKCARCGHSLHNDTHAAWINYRVLDTGELSFSITRERTPSLDPSAPLPERICYECRTGKIFNMCTECHTAQWECHRIEGAIVCQSCFQIHPRLVCESCNLYVNEVTPYIEARRNGPKVLRNICSNCWSKGSTCFQCHKKIPKYFVHHAYDSDYRTIDLCEDCILHTAKCRSCGNRFPQCKNDPECSTDTYCSNCYPKCTGIRSYDYVPPTYRPYLSPKDTGKLLFGIETEVEDIRGSRQNRTMHNNIVVDLIQQMPFTFCKHDGSIQSGFEIVTHPLGWNWIRENFDKFNPLFNLAHDDFRSFNTETCGMHIHMTKDAFTNLHLFKFLKLFYHNPAFIGRVSQRSRLSKLAKWASLTSPESLVHQAKKKNQRQSKYAAVNLLHEKSVEIRVFKGTLNKFSFLKNIEFCKAAYDFTHIAAIDEISVENFLLFVQQHKKTFATLYKFFNDNDYLQKDDKIIK